MVSFKGFDEGVVTFKDTGTRIGYPVSINEDGESKEAINGNDFIGVCVGKTENYVAVQIKGYVELSFTGSNPALGYASLVSNGSGGVKVATAAAHSYKVIKVDLDNNIVGFMV